MSDLHIHIHYHANSNNSFTTTVPPRAPTPPQGQGSYHGQGQGQGQGQGPGVASNVNVVSPPAAATVTTTTAPSPPPAVSPQSSLENILYSFLSSSMTSNIPISPHHEVYFSVQNMHSSSSSEAQTQTPDDATSTNEETSILRDVNRHTTLQLASTDNAAADCCSICQLEIENHQILRNINVCGHIFHSGCLDNWFEKSTTCPICRASIRDQG